MAKPTKDRVPLTSAWNAIKSGDDTLKKSASKFVPNILIPIGKYDQALLNYTKQLTDKDQLSQFFKDIIKAFKTAADANKKFTAERTKIDEETDKRSDVATAKLNGFADDPEADIAAV